MAKNSFVQLVHSNLKIALSEYEKLSSLYEDVRLEKMAFAFTTQPIYIIKYRFPAK